MVADKNTQVDLSRSVNVEFLSHTMPGVGLTFKPEQFSIRMHPGEISRMNYTVTNTHRSGVCGAGHSQHHAGGGGAVF